MKYEDYLLRFLAWKPIALVITWSKRITLPGFDGKPLYEVALFFIRGLQRGAITMRASSVAFNFFVALFPTIIFFFTLIPYIPVENLQADLMVLLKEVIPHGIFAEVESTLVDIISQPRGDLLSLGFILALYFSTSGIASLIEAFNQTYHAIETRTWITQRLISLLLVFIIVLIVILAIFLISFGTLVLEFLLGKGILQEGFTLFLVQAGRWIVILAMFYFNVAFIYTLAPARRMHFRFFYAGTSLTTILSLASSLGFDYYISNFNRYNTLYGSIGTLLVLLLWIYFNAIILLLGFELNASIGKARKIW